MDLNYYLAALLHDTGKFIRHIKKKEDFPENVQQFYSKHSLMGDYFLQETYKDYYTKNFPNISKAIGCHHIDYNETDYGINLAQQTSSPEADKILKTVQMADRCSASGGRTKDLYIHFLPQKLKVAGSRLIPPFWALDETAYKEPLIPNENLEQSNFPGSLPLNENLIENEVVEFNQSLKEIYSSVCEAQGDGQDISLWTHVSFSAALASCFRGNPSKNLYVIVLGFPSIVEWFFNVPQDGALKQIAGRINITAKELYSCAGQILKAGNLPVNCIIAQWNNGLSLIVPEDIMQNINEILKGYARTSGFAATYRTIEITTNNGWLTMDLRTAFADAYNRWLHGPRNITWTPPQNTASFNDNSCKYCERNPCICVEADRLGKHQWEYSFEKNDLDLDQGISIPIIKRDQLPEDALLCDINVVGISKLLEKEDELLTAIRTFEIIQRTLSYLQEVNQYAGLAISPELGRTLAVIDTAEILPFLKVFQKITENEFWTKPDLVLSVDIWSVGKHAPIRDVLTTRIRRGQKPQPGIRFENTELNLTRLSKLYEALPQDFDSHKYIEILSQYGRNRIDARRMLNYAKNKTNDKAFAEIIKIYNLDKKANSDIVQTTWPLQELNVFLSFFKQERSNQIETKSATPKQVATK